MRAPSFVVGPHVRSGGHLLWMIRSRKGEVLAAVDAENGAQYLSPAAPQSDALRAIVNALSEWHAPGKLRYGAISKHKLRRELGEADAVHPKAAAVPR